MAVQSVCATPCVSVRVCVCVVAEEAPAAERAGPPGSGQRPQEKQPAAAVQTV